MSEAHPTYVSDWMEVTQSLVSGFAELTEDRQFIHTDPAAAALTPLGGTVAHGFLSLALLTKLSQQALPPFDHPEYDVVASVNYGFDRIRFLEPVRTGRRIRGLFSGPDITRKSESAALLGYDVKLELESAARPALLARWLFQLQLVPKQT